MTEEIKKEDIKEEVIVTEPDVFEPDDNDPEKRVEDDGAVHETDGKSNVIKEMMEAHNLSEEDSIL